MQTILSIDASLDPVRVALVEIGDQGGKLLRLIQADCGPGLYRISPTAPAVAHDPQVAEEATQVVPAPQSEEQLRAAVQAGLEKAIKQLPAQWDSVVLVIPPVEYLSLNVDLPFADGKSIARVINSELQDILPFELQDLFIEYRAVGALPEQANGKHDVHVSIVPRVYLQRVLGACHGAGIEPEIVTSSVGALSALLAPDPQQRFSENCLVCFKHGTQIYLALKIGEHVRQDRVLDASVLHSGEALLAQVLATVAAAEARYQVTLSDVYTFGPVPFFETLTAQLKPKVSSVDIVALAGLRTASESAATQQLLSEDCEGFLSLIAAELAQQDPPRRLLSNFRCGEFSYNAYLKELVVAGRALRPLFLLALLICTLGIAGSYALREYRVQRMESALHAKVSEALNDSGIASGEELNRLQTEINTVQQQLNAMGSQSGINPLDVLVELSKDLADGQLSFRKVSIRDSRVDLAGRAPNLKSIADAERILNDKRVGAEAARMYCRVKPISKNSIGAPGSTSYDVTLELRLCE